MDISKSLLNFGKKIITAEELATLLKVSIYNEKDAYEKIESLVEKGLIEPVKASEKNGNKQYPLYKKYRILSQSEDYKESLEIIKRLHPALIKNGFLPAHPQTFQENKETIQSISKYLFSRRGGEYVSRKERSYEIFGMEKILDESTVKSLLKSMMITESDLRFYDTPEYCFHDYIPTRKEQMTLLICENKDIWFNIRRRMFEDNCTDFFGIHIDGVVYGNGNKVSQKQGALVEYVKFMGNPKVTFLYWGDIDREGFDIFRRTKEVNSTLDISLFIPGYRKMIEKTRGTKLEDSQSSKKENMTFDDVLSGFR